MSYAPRGRKCSIAGCQRPHDAKGFCRWHYHRWSTYGDPHHPGRRPRFDTIEGRFWSKVAITPSCWLWKATLNHQGYGQIIIANKTNHVHRWAYESLVGPIPEGLQLDHLCPSGHEYTLENTRWYGRKRFCRACDRLRDRTLEKAS